MKTGMHSDVSRFFYCSTLAAYGRNVKTACLNLKMLDFC